MNSCLKLLKESIDLSYSLIGEIILMEKSLIDSKYNEKDFWDNYIQIATILDEKTEKTIYRYAVKLNFFIDPFKNRKDFLKNFEKKDYKAVFVTPDILKYRDIVSLANNDFTIYCIYENSSEEFSSDNIKFFDINKRADYLRALKELRSRISKNYKKRFYLEIIKQNHEIEFSNFLALKSKLKQLKED